MDLNGRVTFAVPEPNLDTFVFCRPLEDIGNFEVDGCVHSKIVKSFSDRRMYKFRIDCRTLSIDGVWATGSHSVYNYVEDVIQRTANVRATVTHDEWRLAFPKVLRIFALFSVSVNKLFRLVNHVWFSHSWAPGLCLRWLNGSGFMVQRRLWVDSDEDIHDAISHCATANRKQANGTAVAMSMLFDPEWRFSCALDIESNLMVIFILLYMPLLARQ